MTTNQQESIQRMLENVNCILKQGLERIVADNMILQLKTENEKYKLEVERCKFEMEKYKFEVEKKMRVNVDKYVDLTTDDIKDVKDTKDVKIKIEKGTTQNENIVLKIEENESSKESDSDEVEITLPQNVENKKIIVDLESRQEEAEEEVEEEAEEEVEDEEEEVVEEAEEEPEEEAIEEEEEEEVFEFEMAYKTYFTNNEENGLIYAKDENGDPGNQIGYFKNSEPFFY